MPTAVALSKTLEDIQRQYGTLARAIEVYLDHGMPHEQAARFELLVPSDWVTAVASVRVARAVEELTTHLVGRG